MYSHHHWKAEVTSAHGPTTSARVWTWSLEDYSYLHTVLRWMLPRVKSVQSTYLVHTFTFLRYHIHPIIPVWMPNYLSVSLPFCSVLFLVLFIPSFISSYIPFFFGGSSFCFVNISSFTPSIISAVFFSFHAECPEIFSLLLFHRMRFGPWEGKRIKYLVSWHRQNDLSVYLLLGAGWEKCRGHKGERRRRRKWERQLAGESIFRETESLRDTAVKRQRPDS